MTTISNYEEFDEYFFRDSRSWEVIRKRRVQADIANDSEHEDTDTGEFQSGALVGCQFGYVVFLPNEAVGIQNAYTYNHPCVCLHANDCIVSTPATFLYATRINRLPFSTGTDVRNTRYQRRQMYIFIQPSMGNRLIKPTAFNTQEAVWVRPRVIRGLSGLRMGALSAHDMNLLKKRICVQSDWMSL